MTYTAFDPRDDIIQAIGEVDYDYNGNPYYYIPATDDIGETIKVRIYNGDEWELPPLPCIRVDLASSSKVIHNINGDRIYHSATIHFHVFVTTGANITPKNFITNICNEIVNRVMSNRNSISSVFIYPSGLIDRPEEREKNRIILHRIVQVEAEKFE